MAIQNSIENHEKLHFIKPKKKSNKQKRKLSQVCCVSKSDKAPIKLMLPY